MIKYKDKTENEMFSVSVPEQTQIMFPTAKLHIIANYDIILSEATRRYIIYF